MPIFADNNATQFDREPVPSGTHIARCYSMIDLGTQEVVWQGQTKHARKVRITFELPEELRTFNEEKGEQPMVISREFTLSMHENSGLRAFLKAWRSKDFTEEEAARFDVTKLLGVAALINVSHREKDGKVYADLVSASPLTKSMVCPPQMNPTVELSLETFDFDVYNSLPKFIQDKIANSPEYGKIQAELSAAANAKRGQGGEPTHARTEGEISDAQATETPTDDLPF